MTRSIAALFALALFVFNGDAAATSAPAGSVVQGRRVEITADEKGFQPRSVAVKKGQATTLVFTRTSDDTCATSVVFPDIGVKKDLPLKQPVSIDVPVDTARTLTFQCGMGMYKSKVVIE
ncbi:MAG: cupredoxin domain-containing protein [Deltaproteobacteria bacterium]|nr:cupredoxin domain-containing protein [Deltaproteobacteria bacterium]